MSQGNVFRDNSQANKVMARNGRTISVDNLQASGSATERRFDRMISYTKTCWYCGGYTMKLVDTYCQCTECGATWVALPEHLSDEGTISISSRWSHGTKDTRYKPRAIRRSRLGKTRQY